MRDLSALTFNLLSPEHADWTRRRAAIRAGLRDLRPDVVALQEFVADDAGYLLGDEYELVRHSRTSADGVGAVLASRHPVLASLEVDLHVTDRVTLPWAAA